MRFLAPSAYKAGGSDLHRACLTRLCCAFRFSQPHNALFLPMPFRLYFASVTLMGFTLQRFSLLIRRNYLSESLPLLVFLLVADIKFFQNFFRLQLFQIQAVPRNNIFSVLAQKPRTLVRAQRPAPQPFLPLPNQHHLLRECLPEQRKKEHTFRGLSLMRNPFF
jgi:hypothetical protein